MSVKGLTKGYGRDRKNFFQREFLLQGVPKKMSHSELRLFGPYGAPLKLTLGFNTPIYETIVCL